MRLLSATALALVMAAGGVSSVGAQGYYPGDRPGYAQDQDQYEQDNQAYQAQRNVYEERREGYDAEHRAYARRMRAYERARAAYDDEYGPGAYERYYPIPYEGAPPPRDEDYAPR